MVAGAVSRDTALTPASLGSAAFSGEKGQSDCIVPKCPVKAILYRGTVLYVCFSPPLLQFANSVHDSATDGRLVPLKLTSDGTGRELGSVGVGKEALGVSLERSDGEARSSVG